MKPMKESITAIKKTMNTIEKIDGKTKKYGYGACKSVALSAFLKVDNRHFFFKVFLSDPIGSSQELTLRATIAIVGSVSSRQLLCHVHLISLKRDYMGCMISYDPMFGQ